MARPPAAAYRGDMPASRQRTVAVVDSAQCDECGLCLPLCVPGAIHLGRRGLTIDAQACTGCEKCVAPCPVGALRMADA